MLSWQGTIRWRKVSVGIYETGNGSTRVLIGRLGVERVKEKDCNKLAENILFYVTANM